MLDEASFSSVHSSEDLGFAEGGTDSKPVGQLIAVSSCDETRLRPGSPNASNTTRAPFRATPLQLTIFRSVEETPQKVLEACLCVLTDMWQRLRGFSCLRSHPSMYISRHPLLIQSAPDLRGRRLLQLSDDV